MTNFMKEFKKNIFLYVLLGLILAAAFFVRVYRVDQILGFYYDQGRDALVIWDLIHKGKLFLIGPTTGIAGIFRGPYYYYLIAPFYFLGQGNPVWPAVFLAFTTVLAIGLIYYLGYKIGGTVTGIFAATLSSFSFNIVMASRWLSNPTPMLLLSLILVWMMLLVTEKKKWAWVGIAAVSGLSLFNFGSSGEFFYFPALAVFALWQRKNWPTRKILTISVLVFILTFLPLVLFDLKHGGILSGNIKNFFVGERSFSPPTWRFIFNKLEFYYNVFSKLVFPGIYKQERIVLGAVGVIFVYFFSRLVKKDGVKILTLLLAAPILGLMFFQGNFGNIYDYYLTGYYLIFILLVASALGIFWKSILGKIFIVFFFYLFLTNNLPTIQYKLSDSGMREGTIILSTQEKAIDWVYQDVGESSFNVDVYVPPVLSYSYDYLFKWYPTSPRLRGTSSRLVEEQVPLLYTLYEVDPLHPERLDAWLARQTGIGKVEKEAQFGGITVQRRHRL